MLALFTRHPASVGESYFEHLRAAGSFATALSVAAAACAVHALLPFLFERAASARIERLHAVMVRNRVRNGAAPAPGDSAPG